MHRYGNTFMIFIVTIAIMLIPGCSSASLLSKGIDDVRDVIQTVRSRASMY